MEGEEGQWHGEVVCSRVHDVKSAATASRGTGPDEATPNLPKLGKTKRPCLFVAKIVGNSMNRVAPSSESCLSHHLDAAGVPAAPPSEHVILGCEDAYDSHLGRFTFRRWERAETGTRLSPKPIALTPDDDETAKHIARFIAVLDMDDSEVTA